MEVSERVAQPVLRGVEAETFRRRRVCLNFGRIGCILGVAFEAFFLSIGHYWGALVVVVCTAGFAANLILVKKGRLKLAGNIYALLMTVGFTVLTAIEGGLAGHSIARLACVPICACLFAGPDSGRVWCVVCLGAVVAFGVSSSLGYHSPVLYPAQWTALVSAAGYLALTLFMSTLGILFETSRQRAFQELHLSLEELSHSEARFRAIFENNALGVALLDSQGKVQMGNGHLAAVLGGLPANLVINLVAMIHPEQRVDFLEAIRREQSLAAVPARPPGSLGVDKEFILELPGLGPRTFRFSFRGMPGGEGICAVLDDVTLQRAAQRDAAQREKSASIDTLLGGIAHELHNKLTPMAGFAEMILQQAKRGRPLEDLADYCRIIHQGAMDSGKIVAQSVDLTHPPTLVQQECDFRKWVEDACEVLTPRLLKAGIRLRLELSSDEVIVNIDVSRIKQVFSNLVCNAIEAMTEVPERHLGIGVEAEGDAALLTVSDNGPGIHAEHRTRLFDPFFTTKGEGKAGLGLSVCASVVKSHGGEITVEEPASSGACLKVRLPLCSLHMDRVAQQAKHLETNAKQRTPGKEPGRAMIVEDDKEVGLLVRHLLKTRFDCESVHVNSVEGAIRQMQTGDFDLVISDLRLPGRSGLDLWLWLRENRPSLAGRMAIITSDADSVQRSAELSSATLIVVKKPFCMDTLADAISKLRRPSAVMS